MPVIRLHLWRLRSCASSICTRGRGCRLKHPAFPAPSVYSRDMLMAKLGCISAARIRPCVPDAVQRFFSGAPQSRDPQGHRRESWARLSSAPLSCCAASGARNETIAWCVRTAMRGYNVLRTCSIACLRLLSFTPTPPVPAPWSSARDYRRGSNGPARDRRCSRRARRRSWFRARRQRPTLWCQR